MIMINQKPGCVLKSISSAENLWWT